MKQALEGKSDLTLRAADAHAAAIVPDTQDTPLVFRYSVFLPVALRD